MPFLSTCGVGAAVANALPMLKEHANFVTQSARGAGVIELIDWILATDLAENPARTRTSFPVTQSRND
jgi:3-deoxy-D-manno-octulosonate 8-phosphate phosphatase KdsC-like HAD superfamily phosphatase